MHSAASGDNFVNPSPSLADWLLHGQRSWARLLFILLINERIEMDHFCSSDFLKGPSREIFELCFSILNISSQVTDSHPKIFPQTAANSQRCLHFKSPKTPLNHNLAASLTPPSQLSNRYQTYQVPS